MFAATSTDTWQIVDTIMTAIILVLVVLGRVRP